ncbi:MAG TPA: DUF6531 domain-containing protein [Actinocrinis sp.]|nr:DUF6531 domain-containing protein [Actinocrinis sp.]
MANSLTTVVRSFVDDTTDAITTRLGPLMEGFTRKTGDIVAQNAGDIDTTESDVTSSVTGVTRNADGDLPPGDVHPGGAPGGPAGTAPSGTNPGDLAPPAAPGATTPPVDSQGVGPCGQAGEPVDVVSGQYVTAKTDLELPGVLPLVLRRAYASGYRGGRLLGPGWSSTLDIRVQITAGTIHFADDDCRILDYPHPRRTGDAVFPAEGERLALTWDRERDEIRVQDPVTGLTWHFTTLGATRCGVDEIRPLTAISDRNGNRIVFSHDEDGLPTEIVHSGGYRILVDTVYTPAGFRTEALRLLDNPDAATADDRTSTVLTYQYDPRGRLVCLVDSTGVPFVYEYDADDRITAWIDRSAYRFEYFYDQAGRVERTSGEGGYLSGSFTYDPANRVTVYTDSLGASTAHHYDRHGHVAKMVDPLGFAVLTELDRYGRLLSRTDELGHTTRFTLDQNGDPIRIERPDGSAVSVGYDALRQPIELTGPDGNVWRYTRDGRGNLLSVVDPLGRAGFFEYNELGALISQTDALGAVTRFEPGRAGLPVAAADPGGATSSVIRDARGRVSAATDPLGAVTRTVWDGEGNLLSRTHPDGSAESWVWDANGSLAAHTDPAGFTTRFDYGAFGRVAARTDPDGTRCSFTHDTELRLTAVANPQDLVWSYVYDPAGRLTAEQDFNGRNVTYAHDPAGRLTLRTNGAGQRVGFVRDPLGRRISKRRLAEDGVPLEETRFTWAGAVLAEQDHFRVGTPTGTATSWDYEPDSWTPVAQDTRTFYADAPQNLVDEQFHAIVTDLVGTPTELVTAAGEIAWRRQAGLWGGPLTEPGADPGRPGFPLRFPGQYHDAETGLDYNCLRYYDPDTAGYTAPDPLGLAPAANHHAYVDNPLTLLDPLGLAPTPVTPPTAPAYPGTPEWEVPGKPGDGFRILGPNKYGDYGYTSNHYGKIDVAC